MLAIQPTHTQKCTPNLLPAQLNRNGRVNSTAQHWKPEKDDNSISHAYFRGRHLHGTHLALPATHTGALLRITDKDVSSSQNHASGNASDTYLYNGAHSDKDEEEEEDTVPVTVAEQVGVFEEVVVWGHGEQVDKERDAFVRGVEEWVGFAEGIHGVDEEEGGAEEEKKG